VGPTSERANDHDIVGDAIIDLRFAAADVAAGGARNGATRIVFSFSSDAELVERSTSDDEGDNDDASFA
jgi:hypothetical protein